MSNLTAIVTTIQRPTPALRSLATELQIHGGNLVVAGDRKGPDQFYLPNSDFLDLAWQQSSSFELARLLPVGHYARKNIAYLQAIRGGACCLYETDDDNAPGPTWAPRSVDIPALSVQNTGWINVYRCFSNQLIWPRGLPLDEIVRQGATPPSVSSVERTVHAPIQQGLADLSPDVDAVWRLVLDSPFNFDRGPSIHLPPGSWCPFNSQSTWWWPEAYPLLYLPSHCSFRMTDIWRSFIAQCCLWELGHGLVFHAPEVIQERNPHDLMRDFQDEIPGYLRNQELMGVLEGLSLQPGPGSVGANLAACYKTLQEAGFFPKEELQLVQAWLQDLEQVT